MVTISSSESSSLVSVNGVISFFLVIFSDFTFGASSKVKTEAYIHCCLRAVKIIELDEK